MRLKPSKKLPRVWGNNVKFRPESGARSAFDLSSCWSGKVLRDWALNLYLLRYHYLSANANLKWNELNIAATWQDNYWLTIGHSTNTIDIGTVGAYAQLVVRWPLNEERRLEGSLARYFLSDVYADSSTNGGIECRMSDRVNVRVASDNARHALRRQADFPWSGRQSCRARPTGFFLN